mmetsp:Transcript_24238/g.24506  ORF Transcript_24238/g.24506 Transcript_24238/m.24506 type:complete len:140 (-) Transcript_24238:248-667(-)
MSGGESAMLPPKSPHGVKSSRKSFSPPPPGSSPALSPQTSRIAGGSPGSHSFKTMMAYAEAGNGSGSDKDAYYFRIIKDLEAHITDLKYQLADANIMTKQLDGENQHLQAQLQKHWRDNWKLAGKKYDEEKENDIAVRE